MHLRPEKSTTVRSLSPELAKAALRTLERMSPQLASRFAARLFATPGRRAPRAWERSIFAEAEPFQLHAAGTNLRGARIGEGPAVLLVHGWGGGGSQLAAFVPPLLAAGCAVVAFDGPAHGASTGRTATMPELADAAGDVARRFGARAAIGHSLGAAAVALALHRGLSLDAAVLVAPPRAATALFDGFCAAMGLSEGTRDRTRDRLERRVGVRIADLDLPAIAAGLRTPALVIHDAGDGEVPFEDGAAIAAAWPSARFVATEGLGHRRILRNPGVLDEARAFVLDRLPRCACGRLASAVARGEPRCETCLLDIHLADREARAVHASGGADRS
jgi:pimeloyl-ACP methyl ester carboxylesterase